MKKFFSALFLSVLLVQAAQALTIGTFNVEYFHIAGTGGSTMSHPAYTREDVRDIARSILRSGADVLAMQELQGEETMRYLVLNELHGWKYYGKDIDFKRRNWDNSRENQNHYFLWNPEKVTFRDNATGKEFTLVCVHLKSFNTAGKSDVEAAQRYNIAKRAAQTDKLNELSKVLRGPAFILGDYNSPDPTREVSYPLLTLEKGYTFDNWQSSIDYIGYLNIARDRLGTPKETETRIERRSTKRKDHPDHDILTLDVKLD